MTYTGAAAQATYSWAWDGADRITSQAIDRPGTDDDETSDYGYNKRNELTSAPNEGYEYDGTGNRLAYTTDLNNELTDDGTYAYTHDDEGNRLTKIGAGLTQSYTWDHRNRLTKVESTVSDTTTTVEYTYDMMDRRIERRVNSAATNRWGYDGDAIALEFDGANILAHRYLHGPVIDQIFADEVPTGTGSVVRWTLTDHLGTVRDVVNSSGTNVKQVKYDSFGNQTADSAPAVQVLYAFTGREYDKEVELQYNRARWYDAKVGRWLSTDPLGFDAGDSNLYRYVNNEPSAALDPTGLAFTDPFYDEALTRIREHMRSVQGSYPGGRPLGIFRQNSTAQIEHYLTNKQQHKLAMHMLAPAIFIWGGATSGITYEVANVNLPADIFEAQANLIAYDAAFATAALNVRRGFPWAGSFGTFDYGNGKKLSFWEGTGLFGGAGIILYKWEGLKQDEQQLEEQLQRQQQQQLAQAGGEAGAQGKLQQMAKMFNLPPLSPLLLLPLPKALQGPVMAGPAPRPAPAAEKEGIAGRIGSTILRRAASALFIFDYQIDLFPGLRRFDPMNPIRDGI
jgi:RHS repeat-associated protein